MVMLTDEYRTKLAAMKKKAQERKAHAEKYSQNGLPVVFVPDGTIYLRFYQDKNIDYCRSFWRHKIRSPEITVSCPTRRDDSGSVVNDCAICRKLGDYEAGWEEHYLFSSREMSICYAFIFEYQGPPSEYIKLNQPITLMGNFRLFNTLSQLVCELGDEEQLAKFFDPLNEYSLVELSCKNGGRDEFKMTLSSRQSTMDPLPESVPALVDSFFKEGEPQNAVNLGKFLRSLEKAHNIHLSVSDPPVKDKPVEVSKSHNDEEVSTRHYPPRSETQSSDNGQPDYCPSSFGNKPSTFVPQCIRCPVDRLCGDATSR